MNQKACPQCGFPADVNAPQCSRCQHVYRTNFANQTQMIPAQQWQEPSPAATGRSVLTGVISGVVGAITLLACLWISVVFMCSPAKNLAWTSLSPKEQSEFRQLVQSGRATTAQVRWALVPQVESVDLDGVFERVGPPTLVNEQDRGLFYETSDGGCFVHLERLEAKAVISLDDGDRAKLTPAIR